MTLNHRDDKDFRDTLTQVPHIGPETQQGQLVVEPRVSGRPCLPIPHGVKTELSLASDTQAIRQLPRSPLCLSPDQMHQTSLASDFHSYSFKVYCLHIRQNDCVKT